VAEIFCVLQLAFVFIDVEKEGSAVNCWQIVVKII
jgi:hypothetical protein